MRRDRFFLESTRVLPGTVTIQEKGVVEQLRRVLRAKVGDEIEVCSGEGICYEAIVENLHDDALDVNCVKEIPEEKSLVTIHVAVAVLKKANFEWVVEKVTELGVQSITPLLTKHTVKQNLDETRLYKIAKEASEQSKRHRLPIINSIQSLEDFIDSSKGTVLVTDMDAPVLSPTHVSDEITLLIGPEGGWSTEERALFSAKNLQTVSFGTRPLRAETAAIAAVSRVQQIISDSQGMR